jgi:DNA-binding IclR family transcriptional regulator
VDYAGEVSPSDLARGGSVSARREIGPISPETGDACPSRKARDLLNTIDRTGKVLNLFTAETPEWGVTEVATTLDLPTSTTFDIVASLAEIGLLQQTSDDRYRLGWRVLEISRRLMTSTCFNAQTHNIVAEVANQLGAVVTLGAWDGQGVVCIANASANRTERVLADEVHISRHASALGKLLMAQLPWSKVQERIDRYGLPALTENSVSDIDILRAQLISARRHDIATEHGETIAGQSCIAVGISHRERHPIAALSICVPSDRMRSRCEEYVLVARRTTRALLQQCISA